MANINIKFKKILKEMESNIKNKEDLEYVKAQIFEIYNILFEEVNKIEELANTKISSMLEVQVGLEERISKIEKELQEVQGDMYDEDAEFSIVCPYCNNDFVIEGAEGKEEVECPECSNTIELDWGAEDEECGCGGCGGCHHNEEDDM